MTRDLVRRHQVPGGVPLVALDGVTCTIEGGSVVALCGPSGSGKSTLLHLMGGLDRPDGGSVTVDGVDLGSMSRRALAAHRRKVGFVFQRFNLLEALSAIDNVLSPVLPYRTDFDKAQRARDLLEAVGLAGRERSLPSRLSGGQQQRVAIARALMNRPSLVLADEPTGNLDSTAGAAIIDLLLELRATHATTVVIATHDPAVAQHCDRVIRLSDGRLIDDLTIEATTDLSLLLGAADRVRRSPCGG